MLKADLSDQDKISRAESHPVDKAELTSADQQEDKQASKIYRTEESIDKSSPRGSQQSHKIEIAAATP